METKKAYDNPVDVGTSNYQDKSALYHYILAEAEKEIQVIKKFMAKFSERKDMETGSYRFQADVSKMSPEDINRLIAFSGKMARFAEMLKKHSTDMREQQRGGDPTQMGPKRKKFLGLF